MKKGCPFGSHRVLFPKGSLPQAAHRLDNDLNKIYDNEILVNVDMLSIDSASFEQMKKKSADKPEAIADIIKTTVAERGKQHNPATGSGGMFVGYVSNIGTSLKNRGLKIGEPIASLVSLTLTPLFIEEILEINLNTAQVKIQGKAALFESSLYTMLPPDIPMPLALAVMDVAGAPAQTSRLVRSGQTAVILGAGGKSGILCAYAARKAAGDTGSVIGIEFSDIHAKSLPPLNLFNKILNIDASDPLACFHAVSEHTHGKMADIVISCVSRQDAEMSAVLSCKERGTVYFFSMATSFTKAALGAEGAGKDIDMLIGNGYAKGHGETVYKILRESGSIRTLFEKRYCMD